MAACKVMYHEYAFGPGKLTWDELGIPHTAAVALAWLADGHARLQAALNELTEPTWIKEEADAKGGGG